MSHRSRRRAGPRGRVRGLSAVENEATSDGGNRPGPGHPRGGNDGHAQSSTAVSSSEHARAAACPDPAVQQTIQGTAWFLQTSIEDHEDRKGNSLVGALYFAIDRLKELEQDIARLVSDMAPANPQAVAKLRSDMDQLAARIAEFSEALNAQTAVA